MSALAIALVVLGAGWRLAPRPHARRLNGSVVGARRRWRRRTASTGSTADYLGAIARELRAGGTVTAAFLTITPLHPGGAAFAVAWQRVADGEGLVDVLHAHPPAPRRGRSDTEVAVHALACAAAVGGSPAPALDAAASVLRDREAVAADARAHSAQARLSGRVLTVVPLGFAAWSAATDQRIRTAYTSTSVGAACVVAGLALNMVGWWWMRRIVGGGGR